MSSRWGRLVMLSVVIWPASRTDLSSARAQPSIMPPGMIEACKRLQDGSPCQFEVGGKLIDGICSPLPNAELACRPGSKAKRPKAKPE